MYEIVAFIIFSILTIGMFSITVLTNNALYALSSLAAGMIFVSAFFFLLQADFLGVVQIVVYTGAIMSLYAFAMMFFDTLSELTEKIKNQRLVFILSAVVALIVVVVLIAPIIGKNIEGTYSLNEIEGGNAANVGYILFTKYIVPFEIIALMLLVAMIGGIVLASKKMNESYSEMKEEEIDEKLKHKVFPKD